MAKIKNVNVEDMPSFEKFAKKDPMAKEMSKEYRPLKSKKVKRETIRYQL